MVRSDVTASTVLRWIPIFGLLAATTLVTPVVGRDLEGRYKDSPLHDWFEHLASRKGLCCSFADGHVVEDADWQTTTDGKHYRVRVPLSADDTQNRAQQGGPHHGLATIWLWRRLDPLFYAGQHDLTGEILLRLSHG